MFHEFLGCCAGRRLRIRREGTYKQSAKTSDMLTHRNSRPARSSAAAAYGNLALLNSSRMKYSTNTRADPATTSAYHV
jgi:hypothetical protein